MSSPLSVSRPVALVCACGGCALLLMTVLWSGKWTQGSPQVRLSVGILLLALALLSILLLDRSEVGRDGLLLALLPVGAAFFLRAACLDYASYDYRDFLAQWAAFFRDNGGFAAIREQVGDYNVPYLYFMAAISYLPMPDLYAIKLFSILFDVILAWGGLRLAQKLAPGRPEAGYLAFLALLLLPTVVLNGSYWGQCDSLYGALVLHALACALEKRPIPSMILLAVAFSFKLQTVFLLPLWGAFWLCGVVKFRHLLVFPVTYFVTALPALLLGKPLGDILGVYVKQAGQYDQKLVYNAPHCLCSHPRRHTAHRRGNGPAVQGGHWGGISAVSGGDGGALPPAEGPLPCPVGGGRGGAGGGNPLPSALHARAVFLSGRRAHSGLGLRRPAASTPGGGGTAGLSGLLCGVSAPEIQLCPPGVWAVLGDGGGVSHYAVRTGGGAGIFLPPAGRRAFL